MAPPKTLADYNDNAHVRPEVLRSQPVERVPLEDEPGLAALEAIARPETPQKPFEFYAFPSAQYPASFDNEPPQEGDRQC
jgi:hypothetical protein